MFRGIVFLLPFAYFVLSSTTCYYPNGDIASDEPCETTTEYSTCCGPTYACLSNDICMATSLTNETAGSTTYVRGSCTDKTWKSDSCPRFCINPEYDDTAGGEGIGKCPDTEDVYYCIDDLAYNCTLLENVLSFSGTPTFIKDPATSLSSSSLASTTSSIVTTIVSSSSLSTTASPSSTSRSTASSSTSDASSYTASSAPPASFVATRKSSNSTTTAIGAGVGVPLAIIALAVLIYLPLRYRQQRDKKKPSTEALVDDKGEYPLEPYPAPAYAAQEMGTDRQKYELNAQDYPQELPATPR